jgi:methionine-rich copper-binding protein CopC
LIDYYSHRLDIQEVRKDSFKMILKRTILSRSTAYNLGNSLLLLTAVLALLLAQVDFAFAHARLKSASVAPGATVTSAPTSLSLTFTEETSPTQTKLQVFDASNKQVDKGDLKVNGDTATISLNPLSDGKYTVKFRTLTEDDGGIIDGDYSFTVAASSAANAGNVAQTNQNESSLPNAPASGLGGAVNLHDAATGVFMPIFVLTALGLLAGAGLLLYRRRLDDGR